MFQQSCADRFLLLAAKVGGRPDLLPRSNEDSSSLVSAWGRLQTFARVGLGCVQLLITETQREPRRSSAAPPDEEGAVVLYSRNPQARYAAALDRHLPAGELFDAE